jgi:acyl dehydratase
MTLAQDSMAQYSMASAPQFVGRELGASEWVAVDQDRIDAFAACTGDRQWIHVDVARARRESPFGAPIAHGYLTLSLVAASVMELGIIPSDAATGLNYGGQGAFHRAGQGGRARAHPREPRCRRAAARWPGVAQAQLYAADRRRSKTRPRRRAPVSADR